VLVITANVGILHPREEKGTGIAPRSLGKGEAM
jgi:hypothetical protein